MKKSKMLLGLSILITLTVINTFGEKVSAQESGKCKPIANQIYYVDSGQSVTEVHPGSNGGNGYQLNILGTAVDQFEVVQERFMASANVIPNYTSPTSAKWQIFFAPNMGRTLTGVRMKNKCTGEINIYRLTTKVRLLDQ